MGRYRSRSRSYSPRRSRSPPRRKQYDEPPRDRYRGGGGGGGGARSYRDRRSSPPTGLLIRNISLDARPDDLRIPFEQFGQVKDVYLPKNYYTGEPRGFGFVKYRNAEDAADAKHQMNHQVIGGREITIVYAEENRKTPQEMRVPPRTGGRYGGSSRRRTPPRSPRRRYHSHSPSPSPPRRHSSLDTVFGFTNIQMLACKAFALQMKCQGEPVKLCITNEMSRDRGNGAREDYDSPQRSISRSPSPRKERDYKSAPRSRSPSPCNEKDYKSAPRSRSPSPRKERDYKSAPRSPSPKGKGRSPNDRSPSRSPSYSPRR